MPPLVSRMVPTKGKTVLRTHNIGTLGLDLVGQTVTLTGWVDRRRDHGGVAFISAMLRELRRWLFAMNALPTNCAASLF